MYFYFEVTFYSQIGKNSSPFIVPIYILNTWKDLVIIGFNNNSLLKPDFYLLSN